MNKIEKRPEIELQAEFIAAYMDEYSIGAAAAKTGIGINKVGKWRLIDERFEEAFNEVTKMLCCSLEDEAYRRAVRGVEEQVWRDGKLMGTKRVFSDSLLIFLMKGKMPDIYRDKLHIEKNTNNSNTVLVLPDNGRSQIANLPPVSSKMEDLPITDYIKEED